MKVDSPSCRVDREIDRRSGENLLPKGDPNNIKNDQMRKGFASDAGSVPRPGLGPNSCHGMGEKEEPHPRDTNCGS
ncbi:hypothetical protein U1Q18_048849 [Sarracenia purpurea var. burkii]